MRITNNILDHVLKIEIAIREGGALVHQKFTIELSKLVSTGLFKSVWFKHGDESGGRFELTPAGKQQLQVIPAHRKVRRLLKLGFLDAISTPANGSMKLFEEYMMQLTKEELPEFLTSNNTFVRELAVKSFDL